MRISDYLASNWKCLWLSIVLILKSLELVGLFCPLGTRWSLLALLLLSAILTFTVVSVALAIDVAAILQCDFGPRCSRSCRGGICWHEIACCRILCDEYRVMME
ncbi:hypothetical protein ACJRO7_034970 [Eucalyptus globulus]|uniref:Transmembrane protein n=1 Tax=Eucalyptus globulus TaxID=34317 RepID=A0ABD3JEU3_EUCGL